MSTARTPAASPESPDTTPLLNEYLQQCRLLVEDEITRIIPADKKDTGGLYTLMLDYPLRGGKVLRPALSIAVCRALGGSVNDVILSATVLELYHNAFLVHDDIEDGSELRRDKETLHRQWGTPIAINVGDGMLAVCLQALMGNLEVMGLGRALRVFDIVGELSRQTAEGQMLELNWIQQQDWQASEREYLRMVYKKTAWYSFIAPLLIGATAAGQDLVLRRSLHRLGTLLGIAFQIRDDCLNLYPDKDGYGKEWRGDLWEGKHTLMLIHALRSATPAERNSATAILRKSRPSAADAKRLQTVRQLHASGDLTDHAYHLLTGDHGELKSYEEIDYLYNLIQKYDGLAYAEALASKYARRARQTIEQLEAAAMIIGDHSKFLHSLIDYVIKRDI